MAPTNIDDAIAAWRSDRGKALLDRLRAEGKPWLLDRTVGIYTLIDGGAPVMHGSGVLVRIADVGFLVSAGHVLVEAQLESTMLLVSPGTGANFVPLEGVTIQHTEDKRDVDIGFARLPSEIDEAIAKHKRFLRLSELDLGDGPEPSGWYAVLGFPRMLTSTNSVTGTVTSDAFYYGTVLYRGTLDNFTTGVSLALAFPPNGNVDAEGNLSRMPHPGGISGCGMWRMAGSLVHFERWEPSWIRLTAIEHSVVPKKAIKGVKVRHVITCIADAYPELRSSIALSLR